MKHSFLQITIYLMIKGDENLSSRLFISFFICRENIEKHSQIFSITSSHKVLQLPPTHSTSREKRLWMSADVKKKRIFYGRSKLPTASIPRELSTYLRHENYDGWGSS